ncbi:MAG: hypothetical protein ABWY06_19145 [Pseudomonas sp.]|uniref:hypothetical protein n=1 Tax=Pseudomonas sp. TaxID=306 RepID=UPI003395C1C6
MTFKQCLRPLLVLALGLATLGSAQAETARPEVAGQVKAYASADGVKVWTLRYDKRETRQALVQMTDIDNDLNQKILLASTQVKGQEVSYSVQLKGQPYVLLILNEGTGELNVPGTGQTKRLSYSEELSTQANAEHYLTAYQAQAENP